MNNLIDFSQEENKYLELLRKNDMDSTVGSLKRFSMFFVVCGGLAIGMLADHFKFSIPYGFTLFIIAFVSGTFISFRQFFIMVDYKNKFVKLLAERTGLKVVSEDSMFSEYNSPQLYNKETKTYYKVYIDNDDVVINEIKKV